jgi:hypothetical protein
MKIIIITFANKNTHRHTQIFIWHFRRKREEMPLFATRVCCDKIFVSLYSTREHTERIGSGKNTSYFCMGTHNNFSE